MATNFRIFSFKTKDSLYIKLAGDFDGCSAYELINKLNLNSPMLVVGKRKSRLSGQRRMNSNRGRNFCPRSRVHLLLIWLPMLRGRLDPADLFAEVS